MVEIRHASTGKSVTSINKSLMGFPAGTWENHFPHTLSFSDELLAVAGQHPGDGVGANAEQVRLFSIAHDFKELRTLEFQDTGGHAFAVEFNRAGTSLAVAVNAYINATADYSARPIPTGQTWSANLLVFSSMNRKWDEPPERLELGMVYPDDLITVSVAFSPDGKTLWAGCWNGTKGRFARWDLGAGVCTRVIHRLGTNGDVCAVSPANDLLATAGRGAATVVHNLIAKPPTTLALPDGQDPLSAALASEAVVVLASGKHLAARRWSDDTVLFQLDTEEEIAAINYPMALQPTGKQVAVCMEKLEVILLLDLQTGRELHRLNLEGFSESSHLGGRISGVSYSTDGSRLLVFGGYPKACVKTYDAATGQWLCSFLYNEGEEGNIHHAVVDPLGKWLVTTGWNKCAVVKDLVSGETVHTLHDCCRTQGLCFDEKGDRLAYFLGSGAKSHDIVICDAKNGWHELRRFPVRESDSDWDWDSAHCEFSPGKGEYLLAKLGASGGSIAFLDPQTGEEPTWSKCFRVLMLPPGDIPWKTVCWVPPSRPAPQSDDNPTGPAPPLILHAAVGKELHIIDVTSFIRSFEEDGNFSLEQLNRLSDHSPERILRVIPVLLEKWPFVVNFRDDETGDCPGDTVLHHCARSGNSNATSLWLAGAVPYTPLENSKGQSALRGAIDAQSLPTAKQLVRRLDPKLDLHRTGILTKDLVAIADGWPRQLVDFIELLEHECDDSGRFGIFRKLKPFDTLKTHLDDFDARASEDGCGTHIWEDWDSSHRVENEGGVTAVKCDATLEVLALSGFAAAPYTKDENEVVLPPYTKLFAAVSHNAPDDRLSALLQTKLMRVATKFKWDTYVQGRVLRRLGMYLMHFALAAAALLVSTQTMQQNTEFRSGSVGGSSSWTGSEWNRVTPAMTADVLQLCMFVTNSMVFYREARQLCLASSTKEYLTNGWNLCDLGGMISLYVACGAHFAQSAIVLTQVGAFGVLLNAFSVLQLLTPFEVTGPLIKTVIEIMFDIRGYMILIGLLLTGFSVSFAVSMPDNEAFENGVSGPLVGLMTTFTAILGSFKMSDYDTSLSIASFLFFLFLNLIVMLNLLIAIMSDS